MSFAKAFIKYLKDRPNPSQIVTDNGPQFKNELTSALTDLLGSEHVFTFAYSKQENGLVERVNKEVMRHMRNIIFDLRVKKHWGDYYPLVERIINSQVHSVTKVSPAQIIYGNAIDLDRSIFRPQYTKNHDKMQLSEWTARMLKAQADIIRIAREHQEEHDVHHISMHTSERTEFPINSYVL
jgi:transposase InsO family protein